MPAGGPPTGNELSMDCKTAGAPCACALAAGTRPTTDGIRLVVASATRHTLQAVRAAVLAAGGEAVARDGLLEVVADDRRALFAAIDRDLTGPEKAEARSLEVDADADTDLVARALTAPSLAVQCARLREQPLAGALRTQGAFHSVYQPIVDLRSGEAVAFEALLRATVDGAPLFPDQMFAAAEEAGWLHVLDRIGRERAIAGAAGWLDDAELFVNFNPTSIYRPEVCLATTERAIGAAGLRMDQLVFEVVESHHIGDMDHLLGVLAHYRDMGCRIAMDDVGAGYSSLNSLTLIRPEVVKLDKQLVHGLPDRASVAVVRSIVSLAHDMGAVVIAECLETAEQVEVVRDLGVERGQGWFFARPSERPREAAVTALPSRRRAPALAGGAELDALLRRAVAASKTGITVADARLPDAPLIYANDAFSALSGYPVESVLGRNCRFLQGEGTDRAVVARLAADLAAGRPTRARLLNERPDGSTWWNELEISPVTDDTGTLTHLIGIQTDVTALVAAEAQVAYLAAHDRLTGLANRARLHEFLDAELAQAERSGAAVTVCFLDLDGFKAINDRHGHLVGDGVLAAVGARLSVLVREGELLARAGGDEFVLVQVGAPQDAEAAVARARADARMYETKALRA
jgi:diguanylate cyclase (GGDEF)-like protein/PAS domain S-box-containing protein